MNVPYLLAGLLEGMCFLDYCLGIFWNFFFLRMPVFREYKYLTVLIFSFISPSIYPYSFRWNPNFLGLLTCSISILLSLQTLSALSFLLPVFINFVLLKLVTIFIAISSSWRMQSLNWIFIQFLPNMTKLPAKPSVVYLTLLSEAECFSSFFFYII